MVNILPCKNRLIARMSREKEDNAKDEEKKVERVKMKG